MNPGQFLREAAARAADVPHVLHRWHEERGHDRWARAVFRRVARYRPRPDRDDTIVIATVRESVFFFVLHQLLAFILARRGCKVILLMDDGELAQLDTVRGHEASVEQLAAAHQRRRQDAARLRSRMRRQWQGNGLPPEAVLRFYSELLDGEARTRIAADEEAAGGAMAAGALSPDVQASHNRFFGGRDFDPANAEHHAFARMSIHNEAVGREVVACLDGRHAPDILVVLDGIYSTFGVITRCFRERGVAVRIHKPVGTYTPDINERMLAITEQPFALSNDSPEWTRYVADEYDEAEKARALRLVASRLARASDAPTPDESQWIGRIRERRAGHGRVVGLFPNLTWDANVPERDTIFDGLAAWLQETVEWAGDAGVLVVLREHPQSQAAFNPFDSAIAMLTERVPALERLPHVMLIRGLEPVSSYRLIEEAIDCSVVYDGTLGLEAALLSRPVVLASRSAFTGKGLAYEPPDRAEYFRLLATLSPDCEAFTAFREQAHGNAVRAAGFQFGRGLYHCPIAPRRLPPPGQGFDYDEFRSVAAGDLDPDCNPDWNRCINGFLG